MTEEFNTKIRHIVAEYSKHKNTYLIDEIYETFSFEKSVLMILNSSNKYLLLMKIKKVSLLFLLQNLFSLSSTINEKKKLLVIDF
jgi:aspartate/methionine/tyrosine aminotransferase